MNVYLILISAITLEVAGTLLLPLTQGFNKLIPSFFSIVFYCLSIYLLSLTVQKLPIAIVYASWAGLGVFSVALLGYIFYQQSMNWQTIVGLFLIIIGVILVNIYKAQVWVHIFNQWHWLIKIPINLFYIVAVQIMVCLWKWLGSEKTIICRIGRGMRAFQNQMTIIVQEMTFFLGLFPP